eukprot:TRINITY_DN6623_c0_g1_i1.p1 TRINITY_DN6623_c0_g1~~TRINITY_DN6623_c0_g1_i1.p1  ORF type:complete len:190 (+),score=42.55 TRINITY_DN6623_c0_g1_i1:185-754(+)
MAHRLTSGMLIIAVVAFFGLHAVSFVAPRIAGAPRLRYAGRFATKFEPGKINFGLDAAMAKSKSVPKPMLECNEATNVAIQDCLEEGCSVEALMELDRKLAKDEQKIADTMAEIHNTQASEYSQDAAEQVIWLDNFLSRTGALRAQLHAVNTFKADSDFAKTLMKAAAVAFGGGRQTDYPKIGVSPYTA